ncbi:uncharacterized protein CIMG_00687 [Coccidioides immitis RS]|uniref:Uncharacterized protein n=2 Tax=Coccidioides immitis TaxID=5501 RepID=J3KHJ0_COCIM|nr:uncharacterized protein CIMG_00687 [Coccidioides immitis RS]EAS35333.3 hypothetical protein CIMG_00687 [Coccidioides immitis RS]KMP00582.1 hypothetical protein CIRG_00724 [Coccidioides immitis RMSCC 2394]
MDVNICSARRLAVASGVIEFIAGKFAFWRRRKRRRARRWADDPYSRLASSPLQLRLQKLKLAELAQVAAPGGEKAGCHVPCIDHPVTLQKARAPAARPSKGGSVFFPAKVICLALNLEWAWANSNSTGPMLNANLISPKKPNEACSKHASHTGHSSSAGGGGEGGSLQPSMYHVDEVRSHDAADVGDGLPRKKNSPHGPWENFE